MRYLRCSLSLLLACVLLLGHCSISSYALDVEHSLNCVNGCPVPLEDDGFYPVCPYQNGISSFSITEDDNTMYTDGDLYLTHYVYLKNGNLYGNSTGYGNVVNGSDSFTRNGGCTTPLYGISGFKDYLVLHANGEKIFNKKDSISIDFINIFNKLYLSTAYSGYSKGDYNVSPSEIFDISIEVLDSNNAFHTIQPTSVTFSEGSVAGTINAHVDFDLTMDAYRVSLIYHTPLSAYGYSQETISRFNGSDVWFRYVGFSNSQVLIEVSDTDLSLGLLNGIIEWLRSIKDGITGVASSIASLPGQIWSFISDGLKAMFIPSEDDIIALRYDWDLLLKERFGAVYQAGTVITDFVGAFTDREPSDYIHFPEVSVNLAGTDFTFGGYDVKIVPDGFDWLFFSLKSLLDIVCTFAFVNALKKRFDNVIGGGSDDY